MKSRKNPTERHSLRRKQLHVSIERIFMANMHFGLIAFPDHRTPRHLFFILLFE
jgi:hypothetical protein